MRVFKVRFTGLALSEPIEADYAKQAAEKYCYKYGFQLESLPIPVDTITVSVDGEIWKVTQSIKYEAEKDEDG